MKMCSEILRQKLLPVGKRIHSSTITHFQGEEGLKVKFIFAENGYRVDQAVVRGWKTVEEEFFLKAKGSGKTTGIASENRAYYVHYLTVYQFISSILWNY